MRVLLADDFEAWRIKLRAILEENPALRIVGEAQTGLEVVHQAQTLKPDLLVLDVGLPLLNGIEAARIVGGSGLQAKILFVSENRNWEIAEEALRTGALGYVVKSAAGTDLLPAINAVLQGEQFISTLLQPYALAKEHARHDKEERSPTLLPPRNVTARHEVAFYSDDKALEMGFARTAKSVMDAGHTVVVIATGTHQRRIHTNLREFGVNPDVLKGGGYIQIDVAETVEKIMADDLPNADQCVKVFDNLIRQVENTGGGPGRMAICGECAPTLLHRGNTEGAIRLEHLWDNVTRTYSVDTLCGYVWSAFPDNEAELTFRRICAEHTAVQGRELGH